ncbi:helix-turn-helix transcriptional regulator [Lentilitoribacter sp. Alg239-R112]|uniref:helix-turn-helix transcriptional regulator n=1 Tax=Lentilitoribacter sp. Alg239-R112 TaxID=2305987 RepID=UPI0013A68F34|nr:helix-turn-helix transcriptional regulator [Lentilitoribacter sp. Alg239-R112]
MQDLLLKSIEDIYDCITDDDYDHDRAIATLSIATDSTGFVLSKFWPLLGGKPPIAYHNLPDDTIRALAKYDDTDEVNEHAMFKNIIMLPERMPMLRRAFLSDEEHYRTLLYETAAKPWGIHSEGVVILNKDERSNLACWFARMGGQSEVDSELLTRISFLNNHLARSMKLQNKISVLNKAVIRSNSALDLVDFGLLLFQHSDSPVFINKPAQDMCSYKDGLDLNKGGLVVQNNCADHQYNQLIARMGDTNIPLSERSGGLVRAPRPSGKTPYNVMAIPLSNSTSGLFPNVNIAVLIFDPELKKTNATEFYMKTFNLTQAEAMFAAELAQGMSVSEYVEKKGIKISTARTQLKSIFAKTETSRQAVLISLLLRSIAGVNLG